MSKDYFFQVFPERALAGSSKKAIKGNTLYSESISRISIPFPPLSEQHRIVEKVDELMAHSTNWNSKLNPALMPISCWSIPCYQPSSTPTNSATNGRG